MRKILLLSALLPTLAVAQRPPPPDVPRPDSAAPSDEGDTAQQGADAAAERARRRRERLEEVDRQQQRLGVPTAPRPSPGQPLRAPPPAPAPTPPGATPTPSARPASPAARPTQAPAGGTQTMKPLDARCTPTTGRVSLDFDKPTDIVAVLQLMSRYTCRNFIYTDDIARGKITLLSTTPVTVDEAYAAFLAALASNNIALYPTGRYYKLVRAADARKTPIPMLDGEDGTPGTEQPVTKIFRLSYADSDQLRGILGNFTSPQGADVQSLPPDLLIVTDIGVNLRRIEKLIETVDRAGAGDAVRIVQIRYASAKDVADKVNQIFQAQGGTPGGRGGRRTVVSGAPAPAPGQVAPPGLGGGPTQVSISKVLSDDRTNKLIVIADEKSFQRIQELIDQLDVPTTAEGGIHVVFLRNANAEEMAQTLSNLASGTKPKSNAPGAPVPQMAGFPNPNPAAQPANTARPVGDVTAELFSGEVKVTADKTQNALLIQASGADFVAMSRLIQKLDRPRRQVFVEAVIMEVNLKNEDQYGVSAHGLVPLTIGGKSGVLPIVDAASARFSSFNIASVASLGGFLTGFQGPVSAEAKALGLNLPSLGLLVQAMQSSSDVNVLSTPHLLATDNEETEMGVGQNVPFQSGYVPNNLASLLGNSSSSAASSGLGNLLGSGLTSNIASIQRQNVELRVKIKPQISEGGTVRLQIDEQVEEIASNDAQLGPTTSKRSMKTQVVAKDQSTIVIGGLIQERAVRSVRKVPLLGSIPILGWLFRDEVTTKTKTNLLLFLTPYIIRGEEDYRKIYERKRKEQQEFVEQFYGRQARYEVDIDWSKKAGPYSLVRAAVADEQNKLENGGRGRPGEGLARPPGEAPLPERPSSPPAPPDAAPPPAAPAPATPPPEAAPQQLAPQPVPQPQPPPPNPTPTQP
ncbi:MAG: type II secretion system secretin GspD [Anaeromyxobacteraceae bacterium]